MKHTITLVITTRKADHAEEIYKEMYKLAGEWRRKEYSKNYTYEITRKHNTQ